MYQFLKSVTKNIFPKKVIKQYKSTFRNVVYLFYKGNNYACNLCKAKLKSFIKLPNNDLLCPRCGSLPRTRRLFQILQEKELLNGSILHFSPPNCLQKELRQVSTIQYLSSDFENEFTADVKYDITSIPLDKNSVDLFIAYHVLEHIEDDTKAIQELFRITKNDGKGVIQTPFKSGKTYEDFSIKTPEERLTHFGQADHVRIYSIEGLKERLEKAGFQIERLDFEEKSENYYGFKAQETVLLTKKL